MVKKLQFYILVRYMMKIDPIRGLLYRLLVNCKAVLKMANSWNIEDENRQRSTIPTENGIDSVRSSYSMIKQRLTEEINKLEDYIFVDLLDFEEFVFAMSSPIESEKIDRIMTTVLRKGNSACEKLIQILRENNILKWAEMKDSQPKKLPRDTTQFVGVHAGIFTNINVRNFLREELEISLIIDDMYEWHLIDLDKHEAIRNLPERMRKVDALLSEMEIVTENCWFLTFCSILAKYVENTTIIEWIRQSAMINSRFGAEEEEDVFVAPGSTIKIATTESTEEALRHHHIDDMNNQLSLPHHIFDVRNGCVEFILLNSLKLPTEEDCLLFIHSLIELSDVKQTLKQGQTFKVAVKEFDENVPLLDDNGESMRTFKDTLALKLSRIEMLPKIRNNSTATLTFLKEIDHVKEETYQQLLNTNVDLQNEYMFRVLSKCSEKDLKYVLVKSKEVDDCRYIIDCINKWKCLNCYRQSILNARQRVINEIDTKMIKDTLEGQTQFPKCLYEYCVNKADTVSRVERANRFLSLILVKGNLLVSFAEVLATKTKLCIGHSKCQSCNSEKAAEVLLGKAEKNQAVYYFVINETGELIVDEQQHQLQHSRVSDAEAIGENGKYTIGREQSMTEFIELPSNYLEKLEDFLTQAAETHHKVKVLSGEDLLKSKLLKEHMGDKFVVLAIKDKSPQVLSNDDT